MLSVTVSSLSVLAFSAFPKIYNLSTYFFGVSTFRLGLVLFRSLTSDDSDTAYTAISVAESSSNSNTSGFVARTSVVWATSGGVL